MTINWHGLMCEHGITGDNCLDCAAALEDALDRMNDEEPTDAMLTHWQENSFLCSELFAPPSMLMREDG